MCHFLVWKTLATRTHDHVTYYYFFQFFMKILKNTLAIICCLLLQKTSVRLSLFFVICVLKFERFTALGKTWSFR